MGGTMSAHQTAREFARANGFQSYESLLAASRRVAAHDGYEHFIAVGPDGREFTWDEDDVCDVEADRGPTSAVPRQPGGPEE